MPSASSAEPRLGRRVAEVLGRPLGGLEPARGGFTGSERAIARFTDGSTAFVKAATDPVTARWLRIERTIYAGVRAPFLPRCLGWDDPPGSDLPLLVLEDLSAGDWPPPWSDERVGAVLEALDELAATPPPAGLRPVTGFFPPADAGWKRVAADPSGFLSLRLCTPDWVARWLPDLVRAEREAPLAGGGLVHLDVRSDNVCIRGRRALLVDWSWACAGNPALNLIGWLPSLALEGGPEPWDVGEGAAGLVACVAGFWASRAGEPPPPGAPPSIRGLQTDQLRVALPWLCRLLGLPRPDGDG